MLPPALKELYNSGFGVALSLCRWREESYGIYLTFALRQWVRGFVISFHFVGYTKETTKCNEMFLELVTLHVSESETSLMKLL